MINNLTIVQMNDSHAYLDLHQELFWSGDHASYCLAGGYARIASVLNKVRHEAPGRVLAFDNGDTFHGTYPAITTKGEALIPALNALDFDAMTTHWEFAYGPKQVKRLAGMLGYPMLACNIYHKSSGDLFFDPYLVKEVSGLKIGIIGIASNIVDKTMPASFSKGLSFTLGRAELPEYIRCLREEERADLIMVLSHLGFPQDCKLAEEVKGIDVLLSGHTHNKLYKPFIINDTRGFLKTSKA